MGPKARSGIQGKTMSLCCSTRCRRRQWVLDTGEREEQTSHEMAPIEHQATGTQLHMTVEGNKVKTKEEGHQFYM